MANCITIAKGMQFWGTHGFFPEENKFGAKFVVDITAESDETGKCQNDDYSTGVSYLTLYNCAKKVVTTEQHKMVQRIAQRISDEIFEASDAVEKVTITPETVRSGAEPIILRNPKKESHDLTAGALKNA